MSKAEVDEPLLPQVAIGDPSAVRLIPYIAGPGHAARQKFLSLPEESKSVFRLVLLSAFLVVLVHSTSFLLTSLLGFAIALCYAVITLRDSILIDTYSICMPITIAHLADLAFPGGSHSRSVLYFSEVVDLAIIEDTGKKEHQTFTLRLLAGNGGFLDVNLKYITRENLLALTKFVERRAPQCKNLSLLAEVCKFHDFQNNLLPNLSYTKLWESVQDKKFELTGFTPLSPGTQLQNNFLRIEKQIAAGGFSAVYLSLGADENHYILKESVLPFGIDEKTREKAMEHFEREAKLLCTLDHPQIAHVRDHFAENGRNYLLLEHLPGTTLRQLIGQSGKQSEERVRPWLSQLGQIVTYLHDRTPPIIHRDLTPDNVIVRDDDKLFLVDFGAANEFVGSATGTLVGKHAYMPPEQIRGKAEPASDLYGLGATIFFCLTGVDPEPIKTSSPRAAGCVVSDLLENVVISFTSLNADQRHHELLALLDSSRGRLASQWQGAGNAP